jgi:hypothetical protein
MIGGLVTGMLGAALSYYSNLQETINGIELIGTRNGLKIYAATVSTQAVSRLQLKAGMTASIHSYGVISTGMMSGLANADGLGPNYPEYRLVPSIPCAAVMARVGDGPWQFVGVNSTLTAAQDGAFSLAINAKDARAYKGYFDIVIEVADE